MSTKKKLKEKVRSILSGNLNSLLAKLKYIFIFRFGDGIGDQLCMLALAEELKKKTGKNIIVFTDRPELFYDSPYFKKVVNVNREKTIGEVIYKMLHRMEGESIFHFAYKKREGLSLEEYMRKTQNKISLIELHSLHFGLDIDYASLKPTLYFDSDDLNSVSAKIKKNGNYAIVNPCSKKSYTPNRDWGFDNFQKVIDYTKHKIQWIQVGLENETLLENVVDMRGKTSTLKELALWIKYAEFVLCNEGMYNHMAAAVSTRAYTVFEGFHPKEIALYETTSPLVQKTLPDCAYCWLLTPCPFDRLHCFDHIDPREVAEIILKHRR